MTGETLFHEALAKPPAERAAFLDVACAGQPELRAEVEPTDRAARGDESVGRGEEVPRTASRIARCQEIGAEEVKPAEVLPVVYDELRKLAAAKIAAEQPGYTLDATALVHEAWLKLAGTSAEWNDRTHFLRTAAMAMRRILVDRARAKKTVKRDGGRRVELADRAASVPNADLLALDEALEKLAATKPDHAKLVELRYFAGLTGDEAAEALGVSPATADRMWRFARAWLQVEIGIH